jgi:uncharacterized protein
MASPRPPDPRRLDVAAFARAEGRLAGEWPLAGMPRLLQDALPSQTQDAAQAVVWSARGELRPVPGGEPRILLHLHARTALRLTCQRCLQPVSLDLDVAPTLRFVRGEAQAEALDEHSEEDVLALSSALDLHPLIEDELILALPLVPRHERCPKPLTMSAGDADETGAARGRGPFDALAGLLKSGDGPGG